MWITKAVEDIAERIVRDRDRMLEDELGRAPGHVVEQRKMVHAKDNIEPQRMIPDVLETRSDYPVPKKSPGVARIVNAGSVNSKTAKS